MIFGLLGTLLLAGLAGLRGGTGHGGRAEGVRRRRQGNQDRCRQGIEWQRPARLVIARGDAKAVRGDSEVRAEVLTAHYRDKPDGSMEVWLIDAVGDVRLTSPGQSGYGETGTFDLDKDTLVISGGKQVGVTTRGQQDHRREGNRLPGQVADADRARQCRCGRWRSHALRRRHHHPLDEEQGRAGSARPGTAQPSESRRASSTSRRRRRSGWSRPLRHTGRPWHLRCR